MALRASIRPVHDRLTISTGLSESRGTALSPIAGVGIDVVEVARVSRLLARYGDALLRRICSESERTELSGSRLRPESVAGRIAVKEAALKALGTGWSAGVTFGDVELRHQQPSGRPELHLRGRAAEVARDLGICGVHVSITHDAGVAAAVVVLERER